MIIYNTGVKMDSLLLNINIYCYINNILYMFSKLFHYLEFTHIIGFDGDMHRKSLIITNTQYNAP